MNIRIYCPACRTPFDVDDSLVGEKGMCPSCQTKFTIRKPDGPAFNTQQLQSSGGAPLAPEPKSCGLGITLAVAVLGAYAGGLIYMFEKFPVDSKLPEALKLAGMMHPLVLHLPIGILIGALLLDFLGGRNRVHSAAVTFLLWLTVLGGVGAALAGYLLSIQGGYSGNTFDWHKWTGISVPGAAGLTLIFKLIHDSKPTMTSIIYRLPLLLAASTICTAGHFGGELTHGFDIPGKVKQLIIADAGVVSVSVEDRTIYEAAIAPILAAKCTNCHGEKKQKGDLRLDSHEAMMKAGESEKASFVAGKSAESESIRRLLLPKDDDDHMPPEEKPQLTADEQAVLTWWVDAGAKADLKVKDAALSEELKKQLMNVIAAAQTADPAPSAQAAPAPAPAPAPEAKAAAAGPDPAVAALEKEWGISMLPLAQNDPGLTFNCVNVADKFGDAELAKFAPLAEKLVELNLSRSKVTDAGLASLSAMKNLKRLNLANTAVTDAGVDQLAGIAGLEYLNLVGTKVTDAAMLKLEKTAALKKLFVWGTGVTKTAAEALHSKLPAITINLGWDSEVKTAQAPAPAPAPTPSAPGSLDPEKPVFAGLIAPIIEAKCVGCHGEQKQKGKLAMHTLDLLIKGGDSGKASIVSGKAGESLIIQRIDLPEDDDDHMPPSDKDQLTEKEVKILKWWIDSGLKNDVKIKDAGLPDDLK